MISHRVEATVSRLNTECFKRMNACRYRPIACQRLFGHDEGMSTSAKEAIGAGEHQDFSLTLADIFAAAATAGGSDGGGMTPISPGYGGASPVGLPWEFAMDNSDAVSS